MQFVVPPPHFQLLKDEQVVHPNMVQLNTCPYRAVSILSFHHEMLPEFTHHPFSLYQQPPHSLRHTLALLDLVALLGHHKHLHLVLFRFALELLLRQPLQETLTVCQGHLVGQTDALECLLESHYFARVVFFIPRRRLPHPVIINFISLDYRFLNNKPTLVLISSLVVNLIGYREVR